MFKASEHDKGGIEQIGQVALANRRQYASIHG